MAHSTLTGADLHDAKGVSSATAGQVYVANGSGTGVWTNQTTPGVVELHTVTLSGASSVSFNSTYLTSTYSHYELILSNITVNTTNTWLQFLIGTGLGPSYQNSNYNWGMWLYDSTTTENDSYSTSGTYIPLSWNATGSNALDIAAGNILSSRIQIDAPTNGSAFTLIKAHTYYVNKATNIAWVDSAGFFQTAGVTTGVQVAPNTGTFSGQATLYGYANQ